MGQILIKKESLDALKSALETLKGEFNTSITDIKTNLLNISNNWKGKKADETLYVIETLNKTNSDLLIRINENIEYIESVISTLDKVESVEVETKPVETPLPTASPTPTPTMVPTAIPTASPSDTATIDNIPVISPTQPPPSSIDSNQKLINNIKDLGTTGNYSRLINYQGANWNFFTMKDPEWANLPYSRGNSHGWKTIATNGTHPFAGINALTNSGNYYVGDKKTVMMDIAAGFGNIKDIDPTTGRTKLYTNGFKEIQNTGGKTGGLGSNRKFHSLIKDAGIQTYDLGSNIQNAAKELESGNLVHCISQNNSSIAPSGHYMVMTGIEKDNKGNTTGFYLLDSLSRTQEDYNNMKNQNKSPISSNWLGTIDVIEPGLIRIENTPEALAGAKLASFRSGEGLKSNTKTIFSYEEYISKKK